MPGPLKRGKRITCSSLHLSPAYQLLQREREFARSVKEAAKRHAASQRQIEEESQSAFIAATVGALRKILAVCMTPGIAVITSDYDENLSYNVRDCYHRFKSHSAEIADLVRHIYAALSERLSKCVGKPMRLSFEHTIVTDTITAVSSTHKGVDVTLREGWQGRCVIRPLDKPAKWSFEYPWAIVLDREARNAITGTVLLGAFHTRNRKSSLHRYFTQHAWSERLLLRVVFDFIG